MAEKNIPIRILVVGGNGQLGHCLSDFLARTDPEVVSYTVTTRNELDAKDALAVRKFLTEGQYNYLVNCAAYTDVGAAETTGEEAAILGNGYVPKILAEECAQAHTKLIHISTDYVFDGTSSVKTEDSSTNPLNKYGRTKLLGEQEILEVAKNTGLEYMIIRTSWLYSEYGKNFVKTIINKLEDDTTTEIKVVADQIGSPTYAGDLAGFIFDSIICRELDNKPFISGIFHYSDEGCISWYDFANMIARFYYSEIPINCIIKQGKIVPCKTEDFPSPVKRPLIGILSKEKVKTTFGVIIPHWTISLDMVIGKIKKNHTI